MFKRAAAALAAALAALTGAHAGPLEVILKEPGAQVAGFDPVPSLNGTDYSFGALLGPAGAVVTYTWLGADTGFSNVFEAAGSTLGPAAPGSDGPVGQSLQETLERSRLLSFGFATTSPEAQPEAVNGVPGASFALFGDGDTPIVTRHGSFQYVLGFNDGGPDIDYDDAVIGVSVVPEPGSAAMLLAGLGAGLFILRRRPSL
ncbi:PEP-CTERM sorting domain-containing protein [Aquabacterium sp. A7-Y]|uniref:PEP-CTERM sorting domain-containing protein n=1 Tax=Aquabacterium sp. A7-Y TaxID=1349605 RepID=UPI00223CCB0E|nr:PEP-CTERM sorting domain-containing protein [Aquabacterium sp. A7-Y]MCW7539152.1 PEP-CTERM sorting domain-containing protein [Aquabacterium sp. A7-Y]